MSVSDTPHLRRLGAGVAALALTLPLSSPLHAQQATDLSLSLILDGVYFNELSRSHREPAGFGVHDHGHDHDHGGGYEEGFNLGHSELVVGARLGEYMDGVLKLEFDEHDLEVAEAYVRTRSLPAGFQLKAGKFLSEVGYINSRHPHEWDFVDRPLVNEYLFGDHGLQEIGVQANYLPATAWFTRLGVEFLQGNGEGVNLFDEGPRDERSGPRVMTAFAKTGPDLGAAHALQFGISGGYSTQYARVDEADGHAVEGDGWFTGVDAVYKYDAGRSDGQGNVRLAGEYFYTRRSVHFYEEAGGEWLREDPFSERQDGIYLEAVYGVAPRWELGMRLEALGLTNKAVDLEDEALKSFATSYRQSAMVSFRPIEPVILRAQLNHNDYAEEDGRERGLGFMLQLNVVLDGPDRHHGHGH